MDALITLIVCLTVGYVCRTIGYYATLHVVLALKQEIAEQRKRLRDVERRNLRALLEGHRCTQFCDLELGVHDHSK